MPHDVNRDILKVKDVLHAIGLIQSFVENETLTVFIKSDLLQSAVIRQFEIIGEAGSKISSATQSAFSNIEWRSIKAFRNLLIHEYFKVDTAEVWATIQNDLQSLKDQMEEILGSLEKNKK
ncbi:MAG: HepT-like ribonuclease domain-containing protein [Chitinophagaceae bacterium]